MGIRGQVNKVKRRVKFGFNQSLNIGRPLSSTLTPIFRRVVKFAKNDY